MKVEEEESYATKRIKGRNRREKEEGETLQLYFWAQGLPSRQEQLALSPPRAIRGLALASNFAEPHTLHLWKGRKV